MKPRSEFIEKNTLESIQAEMWDVSMMDRSNSVSEIVGRGNSKSPGKFFHS